MATVLIRDVNGNTLGKVEVDLEPRSALTPGTIDLYSNGEGWVVTLYGYDDDD